MSFIILRKLRLAKSTCGNFPSLTRAKYSTTTGEGSELVESDNVIIPQYIPRGPTEILEALAKTVKRDPTAPHYKYHDDPYLYPLSNVKKRIYALSQESGRKAAQWVKQEHRDLFLYTESDPPLRQKSLYQNAEPAIEAFIPKPIYNEDSIVTENDLIKVMQNRYIADAMTVYKLLDAKDPVSISAETRQQFLEMMCFYNEEEPLQEDLLEERRFFQSSGINTNKRIVKWKKDSLAAQVFHSMSEKTPAAYCAMIQGMCKHFQADKAYEMYNECKQQKIPLSVNAYNGLLSIVGFLNEKFELQWQLINDILITMNEEGLSPNTNTLNAILESIELMGSPLVQDYALQTIAELVDKCKVEPSLATWCFVLKIFYRERNKKSDVLNTIMDKIENKSWSIVHPKDMLFFTTAMQICRYHTQDIVLAQRIHNLLLHEQNYNLIGDVYNENFYYRNYFIVMVRYDLIESFMEMYHSYVPHLYTPDASVIEEVVKALDISGACEHYSLIWSHIVLFGHSVRQSLVQFFLQSMVRNLPLDEMVTPKEETSAKNQIMSVDDKPGFSVKDNFGEIAWTIWKHVEASENQKGQFEWTGSMLNDIVMLLSFAGRINDANVIVELLSNAGGSIGVPSSPQSLIYFAKKALKEGNPSYSAVALTYLSNCGFPEVADTSKEILQVILNRPISQVDDLIQQAATKDPSSWVSDKIVSDLIEVVNSEQKLKAAMLKNTSKQSAENTSSSSSDSDSDSDDLYSKK